MIVYRAQLSTYATTVGNNCANDYHVVVDALFVNLKAAESWTEKEGRVDLQEKARLIANLQHEQLFMIADPAAIIDEYELRF